MGYFSDTVVLREALTHEEAEALAASAIAWLAGRRIIEDRQCAGCDGQAPCYPPGPDYLLACQNIVPGYANSSYESFSRCQTNGMRVILGPDYVWYGADGYPPVPCPRCGEETADTAYFDAGFQWLDGQADTLACPHCGVASPVPEWRHPSGGFVMLAFEFFYWPEFTPAFLAQFSRHLDCRLSYFGGKK